jgi:voltage-gated potassium channel
MANLKKTCYEILESRARDLPLGRVIAGSLILIILLNVVAAVFETDAGIFRLYGRIFDAFAILSVIVFTVEYVMRIWCCTENPKFHEPVTGRLRYAATPVALIDLFVILPFLLLPFIALSPGVFAFVRFFRIFWILKIVHYSRALKTFSRVFAAKKGEIFAAFFIMLLILVLGSALIYFAEHEAQPTKFSSVLASMWWGIETMATIGYGDMVPITPLGKMIAGVIALVGIGLFALPAGIFASGFIEELDKAKAEKSASQQFCPHCGKDIHDPPGKKEE